MNEGTCRDSSLIRQILHPSRRRQENELQSKPEENQELLGPVGPSQKSPGGSPTEFSVHDPQSSEPGFQGLVLGPAFPLGRKHAIR